MPTLEQKIESIDERLKRWRPKLTRAHNEVQRLLRKRERLIRAKVVEAVPKAAAAFAAIETDHMNEKQFETFVTNGMAAQKAVDDLLTIPPEFKRDADVDALKAERRKKEEAERHKMPLTGKAAMEHIKRRKK